MSTYKLKRKLEDGTLEDVILQGAGGGSCVITDLGYQEGHQPAEDTILELLKPSTVPTGKYLYTYWSDCSSDATLAICYKDELEIKAIQITTTGRYRKFVYNIEEDSVVDQQCMTNFGVQLTDVLGNDLSLAMSQHGVTEALKQGVGLPFVPSWSITATAGSTYNPTKWTVANVGSVTTPTDGMTIAVRTPNDGSDYGILLSIDGGNNYYPLVLNKNTMVCKEYPQGATLILAFNSTQTSNIYSGSNVLPSVKGCWQITDYNRNDQVSQNYTTTNSNYPLLFKYDVGITSTLDPRSYTRYSNNIYANPSTGTIYANDFVVGGKSIVSPLPLGIAEENYSIASGEDFTLEVPATDCMPLFIEIYISQDSGYDQPPVVGLYNEEAGDSIEIPYTDCGTFSIIAKPNGSNLDFYIRKSDGTSKYLDSMCWEYFYIHEPYSQGWSYDTEITVKTCYINTMV